MHLKLIKHSGFLFYQVIVIFSRKTHRHLRSLPVYDESKMIVRGISTAKIGYEFHTNIAFLFWFQKIPVTFRSVGNFQRKSSIQSDMSICFLRSPWYYAPMVFCCKILFTLHSVKHKVPEEHLHCFFRFLLQEYCVAKKLLFRINITYKLLNFPSCCTTAIMIPDKIRIPKRHDPPSMTSLCSKLRRRRWHGVLYSLCCILYEKFGSVHYILILVVEALVFSQKKCLPFLCRRLRHRHTYLEMDNLFSFFRLLISLHVFV